MLPSNTDGFKTSLLIQECGYSSAYHTIIVEEEEVLGETPGNALGKNMGSKNKGDHKHTPKAITAEEEDAAHEKEKERLQER